MRRVMQGEWTPVARLPPFFITICERCRWRLAENFAHAWSRFLKAPVVLVLAVWLIYGTSVCRALCFRVAWVNITVHFTAWTRNKYVPGWLTSTLASAVNVSTKATSQWCLLCVLVSAWWQCYALYRPECLSRWCLGFSLWTAPRAGAPAAQAALLQLTPASWPRLKAWLRLSCCPSEHTQPQPSSSRRRLWVLWVFFFACTAELERCTGL